MTAKYDLAVIGTTWTGYDGQLRRWYPVKIKHRYWTSSASSWACIHIARSKGVILGIPGRGFDGPVRPILLCGADLAHPAPIGPADGGHEPCIKCFKLSESASCPATR